MFVFRLPIKTNYKNKVFSGQHREKKGFAIIYNQMSLLLLSSIFTITSNFGFTICSSFDN